MTESKRPLKVFLCHAHSDKDTASVLRSRLITDGFDVQIEKETLHQDTNWESDFRRAVYDSDTVVICLSKQFNKSGAGRKRVRLVLETLAALPKDKTLILLARLDDGQVPSRLVIYQGVNLFEPNGYGQLLDALWEREKDIGLIQPGRDAIFESNGSEQNANTGSSKAVNVRNRRFLRTAEVIGLISSVLAVITFITGRESIAQFFQWTSASIPSEPTALASSPLATDPTLTLAIQLEQTPIPSLTSSPSLTPVVFTETITPTSEPGYVLVDPQEVLNIAPGLRALGQLAIEKYDSDQRNEINNTLTFTINSSPDVPILWRWFWCAANDRILEQNMTKISIIFDADGYVIPEEQLATVIFENADPTYAGWKCMTYETVMRDWKPGTYVFTQTMTISQAINDGRDTFAAGYKIYEYTVNISP